MNYYNDNDKNAAKWLRQLIELGEIPDGMVDERSIKDVTKKDLAGFTQCHFFAGIAGWPLALRRAGVHPDTPIWTGSCPCQSFSVAGKQKGFDDDRDLWPEFHRLIRECRPDRIAGEQVASAVKFGWLDRLCADLEEEGYAVGAVVLGAHSAGADHIRQRLFWVADSQVRGFDGERLREAAGRDVAQDSRAAGGLVNAEGGEGDGGEPRRVAETVLGRGRGYHAAGHAGRARRIPDTDGEQCAGERAGAVRRQPPQPRGDCVPCLRIPDTADDGPPASDGLRPAALPSFEAGAPRLREPARGRDALGVPDTLRGQRKQRLGTQGIGVQRPPDDGDACGPVGFSVCERHEKLWSGQTEEDRETTRGPGEPPSPPAVGGNYWIAAVPHLCLDGKSRRFEPRVFPLVDVLPGGVGHGGDPRQPCCANATPEARAMRLKGYGNAICVETARHFLEALDW